MLTRLKVSGFKNLVDVDVRFGSFTCVAGVNGVGKSNLFDAIQFLSDLADKPIIEAALNVRDGSKLRDLFYRTSGEHANEMSFEAEMIVPAQGLDDLGQTARASKTFLRYRITLAYREDESLPNLGGLELVREELTYIRQRDIARHLLFRYRPEWRDSAIRRTLRQAPFISTEGEGDQRVIKLHQDGGGRGRPLVRLAASLPRTVLSATNAAESPTALLARLEMRSWRLLQLEPSALRKPDDFRAPAQLARDGSHLAATLHRLANETKTFGSELPYGVPASLVYTQIANRLAELIDDVYAVQIDEDKKRELLTLEVLDRNHTPHPARALSDGTLRFLALAVLELDPEAQGLLCLEEPENGIHPGRIPAMLRLLRDIAVDTGHAIGTDNPLRQVIVNTHSPAVVAQVPDDCLVSATLRGAGSHGIAFSHLSKTWREKASDSKNSHVISRGWLLVYLNPIAFDMPQTESEGETKFRVIDREDLQMLIPWDRSG